MSSVANRAVPRTAPSTRMLSSVARAASSGRPASSLHWSGCSVNKATVHASWLRVVSVPPTSTATAMLSSSSVSSRSPASSAAIRSVNRSSAGVTRRRSTSSCTYACHLGLRGLDEWQVFEDVVVEDSEQVRRPPAEQLPVLFRRAEQTADDRDGIGLAHVGDEFAAPCAGKRVDEAVDDLADVGPQSVGRLGGERGATKRRSRACSSPSAVRIDGRRVPASRPHRVPSSPRAGRTLGASADREGRRRSPRIARSCTRR